MRCHISEDSFNILHLENLKNPQYTFMVWFIRQGECISINTVHLVSSYYEACPESKDTKFLNMYSIFNLQK